MRQPDPAHSEIEAQVLANIAEYGFDVLHVLGDEDKPGFSYTVGLWQTLGQPEVIVFGLTEEVAHELLNVAAQEVAKGRKLTAGSRHDGLVEHYPVLFLGVPDAVLPQYVGLAQWAYEGDAFPVVQLVYPDKMGRWPWDEATKQGFRRAQPVVGERESPA